MVKKILFVWIVGLLLISACVAATPEPVEPPVPTPTEIVEVDEREPDEIAPTDEMACLTVYDYQTSPETDQYQDIADQLPPVTDDDWIHGNPDAPITVVTYSNFQCPACANYGMYLNALLDFFPDSLRVVYRHLPLASIHDKAYIASMASEAAGAQGAFWEMHDLLYIYQSQWFGFSEEEFINWAIFQAEALELDVDQFEADLVDAEIRAELEETTGEWLGIGVHYTPFVVINDRIFRDNQPDLFKLIGIHEFDGHQECPPWVINPEANYTAVLDTSAGEIIIELFPGSAPLAVNSFVFLARDGWYDGVFFHRVLEDFVAQAGDPSGLGVIGPGYTFVNEIDPELSFDRAGILGMANAGVDTNGSQFFITLGPAANLDGGYSIFGEVTQTSLPVLDDIALRDPQTADDFENATVIFGIEIIEN